VNDGIDIEAAFVMVVERRTVGSSEPGRTRRR
jgi:hypothetical protein